MTWTSRYWCKLNEYLLWELLFKTTISIKFPNSIYFFFDFNFGSAFVFRSFSFYFVYIFLRSDYGDSYYWKHHTRCDNGCSNTERHGEKLDLFNYARYDIYASIMCCRFSVCIGKYPLYNATVYAHKQRLALLCERTNID